MEYEIMQIIKNNLDIVDSDEEDIQEAFDAADNEGYVSDGYSNNPDALISFINGYLLAKGNYNLSSKNH